MNLHFAKIGMRTIKTVIAIAISILISLALGFDSPFIASLTAFLCLQSTIVDTSEMAFKRGGGTIVGGIFSLLYLTVFPNHLIFIPIGVLAIIYVCNLFDRNDFISMAGVIFLVISFNVNKGVNDFNPYSYVFFRTIETFIGIIVAVGINTYIKPPNPFLKLESLSDEMMALIETHVSDTGEITKLKNVEDFRLKIHDYRNLIQLFHKHHHQERYQVDIAFYMSQMVLFRTVYSHFYLLNPLKSTELDKALAYHKDQLARLKSELREIRAKKTETHDT